MSALRKQCKFTCFYGDWNCLRYGNIEMLHVSSGTGNICSTVLCKINESLGNRTVCSTVTLQRYMCLQGLELCVIW